MIVQHSRMFTRELLVKVAGRGSILNPVIPPVWMAYIPHDAVWKQSDADRVNREEPGEWVLDSWQSDGQNGVVMCWRFDIP